MTPSESSISQLIKRKIIARGGACRKRHVSMGVMGDPDLYGSWRGRHFEIEVKRPGEQPTALQRQRLQEWAQAGALVGVAHCPEEAFQILEGNDNQ